MLFQTAGTFFAVPSLMFRSTCRVVVCSALLLFAWFGLTNRAQAAGSYTDLATLSLGSPSSAERISSDGSVVLGGYTLGGGVLLASPHLLIQVL